MIMNKALSINSRIMLFYGHNVRFYSCLCDTDDWLVLLRRTREYNPHPHYHKMPAYKYVAIKYVVCVQCENLHLRYRETYFRCAIYPEVFTG